MKKENLETVYGLSQICCLWSWIGLLAFNCVVIGHRLAGLPFEEPYQPWFCYFVVQGFMFSMLGVLTKHELFWRHYTDKLAFQVYYRYQAYVDIGCVISLAVLLVCDMV